MPRTCCPWTDRLGSSRYIREVSAASSTDCQSGWHILRARCRRVASRAGEVNVLQRILLIILVLYALWRIITAWGRRLGRESPGADSYSRFHPDKRRQRTRGQETDPEQLVACSRCGTYVPARRALSAGGDSTFCSPECRDLGGVAVAADERGD